MSSTLPLFAQSLIKLLAVVLSSAILWALRDVFSRSPDLPRRPEVRPETTQALKRFTDHLEWCRHCTLERGRDSLCAAGALLYAEKERSELPGA